MIAVIDYEMGNIRSVERALQKVGGDPELVTEPSQLARADKIVLPGVAAFGDAMTQLKAQGLLGPIVEAVRQGVPYLGFCLGLQLLFDVSYEDGEYQGMGLVPGKVVRFNPDSSESDTPMRVPHMGWNRIEWDRPCPMFDGVDSGQYVYFAHSYHVVPADGAVTAATTEYGHRFASAIWKDNIFATQFHPEKSQDVGLRILENFVRS